MKKKILIPILLFTLVFSLSACGNKKSSESTNTSVKTESTKETKTENKKDTKKSSKSYSELTEGIDWDFSKVSRETSFNDEDKKQFDLYVDNNGNKFIQAVIAKGDEIPEVIEYKNESYPVLTFRILAKERDAYEEFTVPNHIIYIADGCFESCTNLKHINLHDDIIYIGQRAFANCSNLEEITLPSRITRINPGLLSGCSKIEKLTIPEGVTYIGYDSLAYLAVEELVIPESVTEIDDYAFSYCEKLKDLIIPDSVEIMKDSISGCTSLESFRFPSKVTEMISFVGLNIKTIEITNPDMDISELYVTDSLEEIIFPEEMVISEETLDKIFSGFKNKNVHLMYQGHLFFGYDDLKNMMHVVSNRGFTLDKVGAYTNSDSTYEKVDLFLEDIRNLKETGGESTGPLIAHGYDYENVYAEIYLKDGIYEGHIYSDNGWDKYGYYDDDCLFHFYDEYKEIDE